MTNSKKAKRFQFWINVVLILITLSIILPFVLVFISSLTDENTLIRNGYSFFPEKFSFYAYSYIIRQGEKILRAYGITIFVTIVGTAANIAMSSLLAYPLSVKKLPYRRAITFFVFFTMLFNGGLVPTYMVIKDMGLKEPYVGQVALQTSEIAEDLTYYFATSEQVPSAVGLGVLMNKDNTVRQAGGFIVQLMPNAEEEVIEKLEKNLAQITSVTELLDQGYTPEMLLEKLLGDMDLEINDTLPTQFHCNCCRERVEKALISIGRKELNEMIQEGKSIEMNCHFCNKNYEFTVEELKEILRKCK